MDRPACRCRYLAYRLGEGQRARTGEFVELVCVPVVGQRSHGDIRYVVHVDERLRHGPGRHSDLAGKNAVQEIAFVRDAVGRLAGRYAKN